MADNTSDIVIIGGGLTGLTLAYLLKDSSLKVHILEAKNKLGGRIETSYKENNAPIEMGATWLGPQHTFLNKLLKELQLEIFEQELGKTAIYEPTSLSPHQLVSLPQNTDPSYRIKGGTYAIIQKLEMSISKTNIFLNTAVKTIKKEENIVTIHSNDNTIHKTKIVISTLPPYLLQSTITIDPELPDDIQNIMEHTHTWMGESIKVGLRYPTPFWKANNSSGTIFSNVGPIPEFYDHCNAESNTYALKGFFNGSYFYLSKNERLDMVLQQLRKYYGDVVDTYETYEEKVWRNDPFTHSEYANNIIPHQNNGNELFLKHYLEDSLIIAGSETAKDFSGYMEGAVRSASTVYNNLQKLL